MPISGRCPSPSRLRKYLRDGLNESDAQDVEQHVEACTTCEQVLDGLVTGDRAAPDPSRPDSFGRYRLRETIGRGGFGEVYLAYDDQLQRDVAIKISHACPLNEDEPAGLLNEARTLAALDHPHIVPIYDVAKRDDKRCYVVSKYIAGCSLAEMLGTRRFTWQESAEVIATIAEALHYAHRRKVIHRDIKPANILIDGAGKPFVADFGLALSQATYGNRQSQGGTPGYLSPEQARNEGHLVDGRSDIFSLGIVLYEMLSGERPFDGPRGVDVLERVQAMPVRPPRQIVDGIPAELERICMRCLEKAPRDRYTTAADLATDLRRLLLAETPSSTAALPTAAVRVIPRGLRSFDQDHAEFFLQLLSSPVDHTGIPNSIRFWTNRINDTTPDASFRVGLLYGPSGCGKSSLVKAGIIPRLGQHVLTVYVESNGQQTETRLLRRLRAACPWLDPELDLVASVSTLRLHPPPTSHRKVLLVLDQLEQWLQLGHNGQLVQALRHCDGGRVQCLLLVRDEYWMAATRLLQQLDVELDSSNSAAVDLFDPFHARNVLTLFGRAYGRLPDDPLELTSEQQRFIETIVSELSDRNNQIVPVQLALFCEMVKGKPWTPATLREVGGTEGLGVAFLDEVFRGQPTVRLRRHHRAAAQAVLQALLPPSSELIRGEPQTYEALFERSGCQQRQSFDALIRVLDQDLRLITPISPEDRGDDSSTPSTDAARCYQLAHDYLVPALRQWLTRDDLRTFRGRARLTLQERAARWSIKHDSRELPSLGETVRIVLGTSRPPWSETQRRMINHAILHHARTFVVLATLLLIAGFGVVTLRQQHRLDKAQGIVDRLRAAGLEHVPRIAEELNALDPALRRTVIDRARDDRIGQSDSLWLGILGSTSSGEIEQATLERILQADLLEFSVIQQLFAQGLHPAVARRLAAMLNVDESGALAGTQLRAASILAFAAAPTLEMSTEAARIVSRQLIAVPASELPHWLRYLASIRERLQPHVLRLYREDLSSVLKRNAASALLAIADHTAPIIAELLVYEDDDRFIEILGRILPHGTTVSSPLEQLIDELLATPVTDAANDDVNELRSQRLVRAAVGLCRLGQFSHVWPLLLRSEDPRVRTRFIHRLHAWSVDPQLLCSKLCTSELKSEIRSTLILALGEYDAAQIPAATRDAVASQLLSWYENDLDPGMHGAAQWLLDRWGCAAQIEAIMQRLARRDPVDAPWFLTPDHHTMVVLGPATFFMGTPNGTPGIGPAMLKSEAYHRHSIDHRFAISTTEITVAQYQRYLTSSGQTAERQPHPSLSDARHPQQEVDWHQAARYCNWLSEQAGFDEADHCYVPAAVPGNPQRMLVADDAIRRKGYRLPTEPEWEFACRAGTTTLRFHGQTDELSTAYAWIQENSEQHAHAVALLKPNDFGLFDMYGNVLEWCHNHPTRHAAADSADRADAADSSDFGLRMQRGGHFANRASLNRSAIQYSDPPATHNPLYGFRIARTIPMK